MIVDSYNIEFGYELLSAVPYAYEKYLKGELDGTRSGKGSEALYYFSPKHEINPAQRSFFNTKTARDNGLPYTFIHQPEHCAKTFPPYKEQYANEEFVWDKPTLCICNRYNIEWGYKPINFFDLEILDWMFSHLKDKYEIIYFPVSIPTDFYDNESPLPLRDIPLARKHGIKVFTDFKGDWNPNMMKVFSNCEHYITMNGGYSIMASLFSGTNIIYSVEGLVETKELKQNAFFRWYPNLNNVRTLHVPTHEELIKKITSLYIKEEPCLNILIRTFRPNYLKKCMDSISKQDYENINVVLICDCNPAFTREYKARCIQVKTVSQSKIQKSDEYGKFFPYNLYLDEAQKKVNGYILVLDDDDYLKTGAIKKIMSNVKRDTLLLWKVDFNMYGLIPRELGKITIRDVDSCGFCYHSDHIEHTDWSEWKMADFRTAKKLSQHIKVKWLNEVLTGLQDVAGHGTKKDLPNGNDSIHVRLIYPDGVKEVWFGKREFEEIKHVFKQNNVCIELMT